MGNRFSRNIQNVRNIDKLPLNTNEQNDLISDKKGNVYVRNLSSYERITGLKKLEDAFNILQERLKDFDPNNEEVESIIKKINNNKIELDKKINDIRDEVNTIDIPNYEDEINTLRENIDNIEIKNYDKDIEYLQSQLNEIEIKDYEQDIIRLDTKIDALEIPNYDDDIQSLNNALNQLAEDIPTVPSLTPYAKKSELNPLAIGDDFVSSGNATQELIDNAPTGIQYFTKMPSVNDHQSSNAGYLITLVRSSLKKQLWLPYNTTNHLTRFYDGTSWSEWEKQLSQRDFDNLQSQIDELKA